MFWRSEAQEGPAAVRFAYADPPYPGQSARWYKDHPDYAGEVDHAELVGRLCRDYPDGWALSTSSAGLQQVLALCPTDVRVAIWNATNRQLQGNSRWTLGWEPLIVRGGRRERDGSPTVHDVLSCGITGGPGRFPGAKPIAFTRWMLALLGAEPVDSIDDLFPGSGAVGQAIDMWRAQPVLPDWRRSDMERIKKWGRVARAREVRSSGHPTLEDA